MALNTQTHRNNQPIGFILGVLRYQEKQKVDSREEVTQLCKQSLVSHEWSSSVVLYQIYNSQPYESRKIYDFVYI